MANAVLQQASGLYLAVQGIPFADHQTVACTLRTALLVPAVNSMEEDVTTQISELRVIAIADLRMEKCVQLVHVATRECGKCPSAKRYRSLTIN